MLERRRCHPLYIVERLFGMLVPIVIYIVCVVGGALEDAEITVGEAGNAAMESVAANNSIFLYIVVSVVGFLALLTFFVWLSWLNIWISAEDNTLIYESGIITKKRTTIPFSKINTIDMSRNVFQRLLGTCRLKVDTGAIDNNAEAKAEMNIVFSLKDAEEFRSYILNRAAEDEGELRACGATAISAAEPKWAARAKFSDFMLYGLTSSSVMKLFGWLLLAVVFIAEISTSILVSAGEAVLPYAEIFWGMLSGNGLIMLILSVLLIAAVLVIFSNIVSVAYAAIRFFGFRVAREGGNVVVRYGLFTLKNYTVQAENVHAVVIRQNLFQQIIGRCSVEMISIGYGNEDNETNLLFPIIQKKKLGWLLNTLLPEYTMSVEAHKPQRRSVGFLIIRPIIVLTIVLAGAVFACSFIMDSVIVVSLVAAFIMIMNIIGSILRYRNNAIGCDGKVMLVRNGGVRSTTHLIRVDAVQSVSATTGIFQRLRKVSSYRVDFHAPQLRSIAIVEHMNDDILYELNDYIMK